MRTETEERLIVKLRQVMDLDYFVDTIRHMTHLEDEEMAAVITFLDEHPHATTAEVFDFVFPDYKDWKQDGKVLRVQLLEEVAPCMLTVGKVYEVLEVDKKGDYHLRDDIGMVGHGSPELFKVIED